MSGVVNSLEWHRGRLVEMRLSLAAKQREFERSLVELTDLRTQVAFRQMQVDEAVLLGKGEFDPDRFLRTGAQSPAARS